MSQSTTVHVGLDVHKDSIDIALPEATPDSEVRHLGTVAGGSDAVTKALRRALRERAGWKTAVALANKNARILWAVLSRGTAFDAKHVSLKAARSGVARMAQNEMKAMRDKPLHVRSTKGLVVWPATTLPWPRRKVPPSSDDRQTEGSVCRGEDP